MSSTVLVLGENGAGEHPLDNVRAIRASVHRQLQVWIIGRTTKPKGRIYAQNAQMGRTPATITAEQCALQVILPR